MESLILNQFSPADKAAWRAQVQKDLKDPLAPESLRWETDLGDLAERITLDPYYTAEDLVNLPIVTIQSAQKQSPGWLNTPAYTLTNDARANNQLLRQALARGADALILSLPVNPDLPRLLDGIKLSDTPVFFRVQGDLAIFLENLRQIAPYQLRGGLLTDGIVVSALHLSKTDDSPSFRSISVSSHVYHNAGANATQELAFVLAALADRYDTLTEAGLSIDQLMAKTMFSLAIGTSYFIEIAKLRALRVLWPRFINAYKPAKPLEPAFIHAQTSVFYNATRSPYTNLLRNTTEAMAAIIGGCDSLTVQPFNSAIGHSISIDDQSFADRIARNISILLKDESYLDKVADPSAGSYYIETLTHTLTEAAWALFLRVEAMGGLAKAPVFMQNEIDAAYQQKLTALQNGRVMVGVNKYQEDLTGDPRPTSTSGLSRADLTNRPFTTLFE